MSMAYWAPPTAWAAARMIPSCMTASQVAQPLPVGADPVGRGHPDLVEVDPVLGVRGDGHLLGQGHAGGGRVDQEQVDVPGAVTGAGQDHQTGGGLGEGHVALGAGEDEAVAVGHRPDLHAPSARSRSPAPATPG